MRAKKPAVLYNKRFRLQFDAILNRTRGFTAQVTQYPTEKGFYISDSVLKRTQELSFVGVVSNLPIHWEIEGIDSRFSSVLLLLEKMCYQGELFIFEAGGYKWDSMAIQSVDIPEKEGNLNYSEISITLKKVYISRDSIVEIVPKEPLENDIDHMGRLNSFDDGAENEIEEFEEDVNSSVDEFYSFAFNKLSAFLQIHPEWQNDHWVFRRFAEFSAYWYDSDNGTRLYVNRGS